MEDEKREKERERSKLKQLYKDIDKEMPPRDRVPPTALWEIASQASAKETEVTWQTLIYTQTARLIAIKLS